MNKPDNLIVRTEPDTSDIAFIDLKAQQALLKDGIDEAIQTVLSHGRYISGPEIDQLEEELARRTGAADVVGVASGTDALIIPLVGEGIGHGDAVFLPSFTYNASANAVLHAGATPVFVDIDVSTFNMDPNHLSQQIDAVKAKGELTPKAIMTVDLFGLPVDYAAIDAIANAHGLLVLADSAQSFGGAYKGKSVGSLAPITGTSFFPSKTLGCYGDAGAIFSMDKERADLWRSIRFHGTDDQRKESLRVGINGRIDTLQAAILLVKLSVFDDEWHARDRAAQIYLERLGERLSLPKIEEGVQSSWGLFSTLARDMDDRSRLQNHLKSKNIPSAIYYTLPLHQHTAFKAYGPEGGLPVCEEVSSRIFSLPMHPYLTEAQVHRVCDAILEVN